MRNQRNILRIQRSVSIVISVIGYVTCIVNFTHYVQGHGMIETLAHPAVSVLLLLSTLVLIIGFIDRDFARIMQVVIVFITGAIAVLDQYDSIFGIGLYLICAIIAFKYGYFKQYTILKVILAVIAVYLLTLFSASRESGEGRIVYGLYSILYMTFFIVVLYLIYSDQIREYVARAHTAEKNATELIVQRQKLNDELAMLNQKLANIELDMQPVDLKAVGITQRERDVLEALILYRESEKEIAERLIISHETVKTHMKNIRRKLGVERRTEIIELCRNNFINGKKK